MSNYLEQLKLKSELKVMFICLGNICRSPMAAAVLHTKTRDWTAPKILVSSSGTGSWHVGEGPNQKSKKVWESAGYQYDHVAQQFKNTMFDAHDLFLVMDKSNYDNVMALSTAQSNKKVFFLRQLDPALSSLNPIDNYRELEVPDPYYEPLSAYQEVLQMVESSVDGLLQLLIRSSR